jgi:CubicO group peptidase (beta-lactamase class C family)
MKTQSGTSRRAVLKAMGLAGASLVPRLSAPAVPVGFSRVRTLLEQYSGVSAHGEGWGAGGRVILASDGRSGPLGRTRGTYGWEGAAGTTCWVDPASGIFAVLMAQFMPNHAYELHTEFTEAILGM